MQKEKTNKPVILNSFQDLHRLFSARGFTLIELLVVVLIIGILAAVAVSQYNVAVLRSRYNTLLPHIQNAVQNIELFRLANGHYPDTLQETDFSLDGCIYQSDNVVVCGKKPNRSAYTYVTDSDGTVVIHGQLFKNSLLRLQHSAFLTEDTTWCAAKETDSVANAVCKRRAPYRETRDGFFLYY